MLGIDFDNTIVCYDALFHALALERGLIPRDLPATKAQVRDFLRAAGREEEWTRLQGIAYGPRIGDAAPFAGVIDFLRECRARAVPVRIISHKTRAPFLGEPHDLHEAARHWLRRYGVIDAPAAPLRAADVCLELTKQAKLARIAAVGCTHFVDDLPEFLTDPAFPAGVVRYLWDPSGDADLPTGVIRLRAWSALASELAREVAA